jgi:hypothetical protein
MRSVRWSRRTERRRTLTRLRGIDLDVHSNVATGWCRPDGVVDEVSVKVVPTDGAQTGSCRLGWRPFEGVGVGVEDGVGLAAAPVVVGQGGPVRS